MAAKFWAVIVVTIGLFFLVTVIPEVNAPTSTPPWQEITPSGAQPPSTAAGISEVTPQVSAAWSAIIAHGLGNAPMTGMLISALALAVAHHRRARAQQAFDPRAPLRDGPAMIFGEVESLPDHEGAVVEIQIEQHGTEHTSKSSTNHTWKEIDREVRVSPFFVVRGDGTRVRVEPDEQVALEDGLVVIVGNRSDARARRAALSAGARVHIDGELRGASRHAAREDAYRSPSSGPVLSPPRFGRMVISTKRPGETEETRAGFHLRWAAALAVLFALLAGVWMPSYELLAFDGKAVMAEVTGSRTWQERVKPKNKPSRLVTYYSVRARMPSGDGLFTTLEDDCNEALYTCVAQGRCAHVPFVVSTHLPSLHQLVARPALSVSRCIGILMLTLFLGLAYTMSTNDSQPWYMKKKLDESGRGKLSQAKA